MDIYNASEAANTFPAFDLRYLNSFALPLLFELEYFETELEKWYRIKRRSD